MLLSDKLGFCTHRS